MGSSLAKLAENLEKQGTQNAERDKQFSEVLLAIQGQIADSYGRGTVPPITPNTGAASVGAASLSLQIPVRHQWERPQFFRHRRQRCRAMQLVCRAGALRGLVDMEGLFQGRMVLRRHHCQRALLLLLRGVPSCFS
eukprot:s2638_g3.t1